MALLQKELHKEEASKNIGVSVEWVRERLKLEATLSTEQDEKATPSARIKALELLGKDEGMFVDRKEVTLKKPIEDMTLEEKVELYNVIASKN